MSGEEEEEATLVQRNKLLMNAMIEEMRKMVTTELNNFRQEQANREGFEQKEHVGPSKQRKGKEKAEDKPKGKLGDHVDLSDGNETEGYYQTSSSTRSRRRSSRHNQDRGYNRDNFHGIKLKIPPFHGKCDPDEYLDWEKKIELVFIAKGYTEENKLKVAATEFYDYALNWWDQLVTTRRRNQEYPVSSWNEMKNLMRKRFVPSHYNRDLHQKLSRLTQGSRTVEEYYQEMEKLMLRADIVEDKEATLARFIGGLNREVQDRLEVQYYMDIEECLHKAVMFEQQIKRKGSHKGSYNNYRTNFQRDEKTNTSKEIKAGFGSKTESAKAQEQKDKTKDAKARTRDVKCFKCQGRGHYANECINKRTMVLRENGDVTSEEEAEDKTKESSEEMELLPVRGELLVMRKSSHHQPRSKES